MAACAENQTRVQTQGNTAVFRGVEPFGDDHKFISSFDRHIILPPVVFPVTVLYGRKTDILSIGSADLSEHRVAILIVCQIAFDAAHTGEALLQLFIHIVPVLPVVFQKTAEIRFIFDHKAFRTHLRHL